MKEKFKDNWEILLVILLVAISVIVGILSGEDPKKLPKETNKVTKEETTNYKLAFFGDSQIKKYNIKKYYKNYETINISREAAETSDLLLIMDDLYKKDIDKVIIYAGMYDIVEGNNDETYNNYKKLITNIKENMADTQIYIISILSTNKEKGNEYIDAIDQSKVSSTNILIKDLCKKENVNFVNAYLKMNDGSSLDQEYTDDGFNLNEKGYIKITDIIKKNIK